MTQTPTEAPSSRGSLTPEQIIEDSKRYTLYDWSAQAKVSPLPIERASGVYLYGADGRRWIDMNSQLMGVNIGHADPRVAAAIARQAETLPYLSPFLAYEGRALLGRKLAELFPGDIEKSFFTLGGAEANENAVKIARMVTGRNKVLTRYRSYHGATALTGAMTGEPRRWASEPAAIGVVHMLDPYHGPERPVDDAETALTLVEETIQLEGPESIACVVLETVPGANGILIPPDGYLQGVREICDRYGILMIADEVMCGFGRTGKWFAVEHWDVVPDLITVAKGLTSSYAPLGAVGMRPHVAEHFENNVFWGGLTYNSHPIGVAAALAAIDVLESDGLVEHTARMEPVLRAHHEALAAKHSSVGLHRNIGLFGILELVKNRETMEPLSPFNTVNETMGAIHRSMLDNGVFTLIRWHAIMTNPPLCITEDELAAGFEVIDRALDIADAAMED